MNQHYKFLLNCIRGDIAVAKSLIADYDKEIEKAKKNGNLYVEGLLSGCKLMKEQQLKHLTSRLQIIGEELEDGLQPGSLEPVTR